MTIIYSKGNNFLKLNKIKALTLIDLVFPKIIIIKMKRIITLSGIYTATAFFVLYKGSVKPLLKKACPKKNPLKKYKFFKGIERKLLKD